MKENEQDYVKTTFSDVAHNYDEIPFFKISATHIVDIIQKYTTRRPLKILDVACGTGNVVLECASSLQGCTFDAIDISEDMLAKAKENAVSRDLSHINFQLQDVIKLEVDKKYDVITCGYALFFLPDAPRVLANLISHLRRNGKVIFTSFTDNAFVPSDEILLPLLDKYGSHTAKEYDMNKWENLKTKKDIERLCTLSYVMDMEIQTKEISYGMSIDEWWELMNNTGHKGMLKELSSEDYENVKSEYYKAMLEHADMDGEVELIADSHFVIAGN